LGFSQGALCGKWKLASWNSAVALPGSMLSDAIVNALVASSSSFMAAASVLLFFAFSRFRLFLAVLAPLALDSGSVSSGGGISRRFGNCDVVFS
jgi:hypothetical protein